MTPILTGLAGVPPADMMPSPTLQFRKMAEVLWRVVTLMESDCPAVNVPPAMDTVCVSAPVPEENAASLSHAAGREGLISSPPVYLMFRPA